MTRAKHLGFKRHEQIHRVGPGVEFTIGGPADGIEIGKGPVEIVTRKQDFLLRVPDDHMVRRFTRRHDKFKVDAGHGDGCSLLTDQARRLHHAAPHALKRAIAWTDPNADDFIRIGQANAELTLGARLHRKLCTRMQRIFNQWIL